MYSFGGQLSETTVLCAGSNSPHAVSTTAWQLFGQNRRGLCVSDEHVLNGLQLNFCRTAQFESSLVHLFALPSMSHPRGMSQLQMHAIGANRCRGGPARCITRFELKEFKRKGILACQPLRIMPRSTSARAAARV